MRVSARLFSSLKRFLPADAVEDAVVCELPAGATVADLLVSLGLAPEHAGIVVSKQAHLDRKAPLEDGQEVQIFPPLAGGVGRCAAAFHESLGTSVKTASAAARKERT